MKATLLRSARWACSISLLALAAVPQQSSATAIQYRNADGINDTPVSAATPLPVTTSAPSGTQDTNIKQVGGATAGSSNPLYTSTPNAGSPTYVYTTSGYAAYATPTDMVGICGSATKTVKIVNAWMAIGTTSAALQTIHFVKRSTADTGGTDGAPTGIPVDSANAAPSATLHSYTVAPTPGASVGDVRLQAIASAVLTAAPGTTSLSAPINVEQVGPNSTNFDQLITLRGTAECLYLNYAGAALTGGFTATWGVQWTELPNTF